MENSKTEAAWGDRRRGARPGHLSEAPTCCSSSESSENPTHSSKEVPVLRRQRGTPAPGTAETAQARGRVPRTVPGPGRGSLCCTSPPPATVRTAARPRPGRGVRVPRGSPRAAGRASPGGSRAGRFPPAFHPRAEQAAGYVPEPQAPGKAGSLPRALDRVRNGPLEFYKENTTVLSSSRLTPTRLPAPTSPCASFPEALRIAHGKEKPKLSLGRQHLAGSEGAQGTFLGSGGRGARCGAPGLLPLGPLRRIPGARRESLFGPTGSSPGQPAYRLDSRGSVPGDFHGPPWRLGETPGSSSHDRPHRRGRTPSRRPLVSKQRGDLRPRLPRRLSRTAAGASPELCSRRVPGPFKFTRGDGRKRSESQARRPAHPARWQGRGWKGTGDFS